MMFLVTAIVFVALNVPRHSAHNFWSFRLLWIKLGKQWQLVMDSWPSHWNDPSWREMRPVEQVSYNNIRGSSLGAV